MSSDAKVAAVPTRRLGRVPALDGIRGIAILLVLVSHSAVLTGKPLLGSSTLDGLAEGGYLGVDTFFVLSGFLITALLLSEEDRHGSVRFWMFYARRALRLFPALALLLAVYLLYTLATGRPLDPALQEIGYAAGYVTNWRMIYDYGSLQLAGMEHLWSLAIEEQFYLVWPAFLLLFLGLKRTATVAIAGLVTLIVVVIVWRAWLWQEALAHPPIGRLGYVLHVSLGTDTRVDSLLIGALAATLWVRRRTPSRGLGVAAWIGVATIAVFVVATSDASQVLFRGGFDLIALATACIVLATVDGRWRGIRVLEARPLRVIGLVSYGVYLWHFPVFFAVDRHFSTLPDVGRLLLGYALTAAAAAGSWLLVEQPALRLKRRVERTTDTGVAPATS
jgi:peptidoglycan/LPS O-acetylase OafA/YrhL